MKSSYGRRKIVALCIAMWAALAVVVPAQAATIGLEGTGTVTGVTTFGGTPTGSIAVGNALAFSFDFDPATATSLFNGGPSLQVFAQPFTDVSVTAGSYGLTPANSAASPSVILFGTAFRVFPGDAVSQAVLNQQFIIPGLATGNLPFATAQGSVNFTLTSTFRQDLMGATPNLSNLQDPSAAAINRFQISVHDGRRTIGIVEGDFTAAFVNSAVPEPSTWALLILGFGAIGAAMRKRRVADLLHAA